MSFSKIVVSNPDVVAKVLSLYRETPCSMKQIATHLGIGMANTHEIIKRNIPVDEMARLKSLRYRNNKLGVQNPGFGKRPANFIGDCEDGRGYLTRVVDGKRYFVHRIVMAEMLGMHPSQLPESLIVHHVDENKQNNSPDNLVLSNKVAHTTLHRLMDWKSALSA